MAPVPTRPLLVAIGLCAVGCFTSDDGLEPPDQTFYFPTSVIVSPHARWLYVTSSDFDLQYNGGTVQVLNLDELRIKLEKLRTALGTSDGSGTACGAADLAEAADKDRILSPGPCVPFDIAPGKPFAGLTVATVNIGAFASGAVLVPNPNEGSVSARLFVTVRGDPSVTYLTVPDDARKPKAPPSVDCGAPSDTNRCGNDHKIGRNPADNERHLTIPVEPVGIAASEDGTSLVVANQTTSQASLITNGRNLDDGSIDASGPRLEYILTDLPSGPTEVASVPVPGFVKLTQQIEQDAEPDPPDPDVQRFDYQPGFLMTYRASPEVDLLRFQDDRGGNPPRPFLTRAFAEGITVNSSGSDSRGLAVDASARQACEADCGADLDCLAQCIDIPVRLFVANRAPTTLLIGEVRTELTLSDVLGSPPTGAFDTITIFDSIPVAFGASKVAIGNVIGPDNLPHLRVFAVTFDSRTIFSYDPEARRVETVIHTGRGPHAIAFDTEIGGAHEHSYLYVAHFTDSYVGVVDLDQRNRATYGSMFASVGVPIQPREQK